MKRPARSTKPKGEAPLFESPIMGNRGIQYEVSVPAFVSGSIGQTVSLKEAAGICGYPRKRRSKKINSKRFPRPEQPFDHLEYRLMRFSKASRRVYKKGPPIIHGREIIPVVEVAGYEFAGVWEMLGWLFRLTNAVRKQILGNYDVIAMAAVIKTKKGATRVPCINRWRRRLALSEGDSFSSQDVFLVRKVTPFAIYDQAEPPGNIRLFAPEANSSPTAQ